MWECVDKKIIQKKLGTTTVFKGLNLNAVVFLKEKRRQYAD